MSFMTINEARAASRARSGGRIFAEAEVRKSAKAAMDTEFDIFMSHSFKDAEVIEGIKIQVERTGLSVYVDWIEDAQMNRSNVTPETADTLRQRMAHCQFLLYATSDSSSSSKWMPWELGYFDGLRKGKVGVFPLVASRYDTFRGQEYLGLYPVYEWDDFDGIGKQVARSISETRGILLKSDIGRRI